GRALDLAAMLAFGDRLALLELPLASSEREVELRETVGEVDAKWYEREPTFRGLPDQALDLGPVQQQLARPLRVVPSLLARLIRWDVHALDPDLAVSHAGERLRQRRSPAAERLHLGAGEGDARLEPLEDLVLVTCLAVRADGPLAGVRL